MIEIRDLHFFYKKKSPIFENVSFTMKNGVYGLLGENGVGKTTLLHLICGLRFAKSGTCEVMGYNSVYRNPNMLSQIFFLPEEFQTHALSITDYVKYNASFYPNFSKEQIEWYLTEFQVDRNKKMTELSFGQKKKAMIAFALALNTPVTLLDEPTNGLDIPSKAQFRKIISSITNENRCIVVSTHQVRDLENIIDPIIILDYNQVLINNSVEEITQKLKFTQSHIKPENSLYSEQNMGGYSSVEVNTTNVESTFNIEALFNAVILNKAKIKDIFNS